MSMKKFVGLLVPFALVACASTQQLAQTSSARTLPCQAEDIVVTNTKVSFSTASWNSNCKGKAYYCSGINTGEGNIRDVSCKEVKK